MLGRQRQEAQGSSECLEVGSWLVTGARRPLFIHIGGPGSRCIRLRTKRRPASFADPMLTPGRSGKPICKVRRRSLALGLGRDDAGL